MHVTNGKNRNKLLIQICIFKHQIAIVSIIIVGTQVFHTVTDPHTNTHTSHKWRIRLRVPNYVKTAFIVLCFLSLATILLRQNIMMMILLRDFSFLFAINCYFVFFLLSFFLLLVSRQLSWVHNLKLKKQKKWFQTFLKFHQLTQAYSLA